MTIFNYAVYSQGVGLPETSPFMDLMSVAREYINVKRMNDAVYSIPTGLSLTTKRAVKVFPVKPCQLSYITNTMLFNQVPQRLNKYLRVVILEALKHKCVDVLLSVNEVKRVIRMCFFFHNLVLQVIQNVFSFLDVACLRTFMPTIHQQDNLSVADGVINTVALRNKDPHFGYTIIQVFDITKVTKASSNYAHFNCANCSPVFEFGHPFKECIRPSYCIFHAHNVAYTQQINNKNLSDSVQGDTLSDVNGLDTRSPSWWIRQPTAMMNQGQFELSTLILFGRPCDQILPIWAAWVGSQRKRPQREFLDTRCLAATQSTLDIMYQGTIQMIYTFLIANGSKPLTAITRPRFIATYAQNEQQARDYLKGLPLTFIKCLPVNVQEVAA